MQKPAVTAVPINQLLAERWSPRAFDANYQLTDNQLLAILEAGRWAPSANNGQPWRFSAARRGEALFDAIIGATTGFNQAWMPSASAVILVSALHTNANGEEYRTAKFDAGLAVQNILIQTVSEGLSGHVVGGMVHDAMIAAASLPEELHPIVVVVIGKQGDASLLNEAAHEREVAARTRRSLDEIVLAGKP